MANDFTDGGRQKKKSKLPLIIALVLAVAVLAAAGFFLGPKLVDMIRGEQAADVDGDDDDDEEVDEDEEIASIISRAEKLADDGKLDRALARIEKGLESYPKSKKLQRKAEEYTSVLEEQTRGVSVTMERLSDSFYESAVFTGLSAQGDAVWTYETETYPLAQLDRINEIGVYGDGYYLVEDGSVYVLNIADGSVRWINGEFDGSASGSVFDDDGTLYLCGHLGPDLFIVDKDGNTVHKTYAFDSGYLWPYEIAYQKNRVAITFGETPPGADDVVYVDLRDYSASITKTAAETEVPQASLGAVSTVTATSYLEEPQYGFVHGPSNVIDGDLTSAWVEGADGQGEGESITLHLDGVYTISGFTIHAGYQKSTDTYHNNSRPASLRVTFSDGAGIEVSLEDFNGEQIVTFDTAVNTSNVTFTILSVYPGSTYQDTAITDISLF